MSGIVEKPRLLASVIGNKANSCQCIVKNYRRTLIILSVGNMSCSDEKVALFTVVICLKANLLNRSENLLHICINLAALRELAPVTDGVKSAVSMRTANIDCPALDLA